MKILVACEFSGRVRDAFTRLGHDAVSCDLIDSLTLGQHYKGDVRDLLNERWDILIAFPPCTHLAVSGARHFYRKQVEQNEALNFVRILMNCDIPRIAVENPVGIISTSIRKPDQIIQPWMFGHGEVKTTCLWLKNLPLLKPTNIVEGREQKCWRMAPSVDRAQKRSLTYEGISEAMATQWGDQEVQQFMQLALFEGVS